jgi:hypothetical protein
MYGVIRKYRTTDIEELSRRVQDEFVPKVREVPGFVAYYVIDGGDGSVASITLCETSSGVEESTSRATQWVGDAVSDLVQGDPEVTAGEVRASS